VRPGIGREGALGYERYIAREHMDKLRPEPVESVVWAMCGAIESVWHTVLCLHGRRGRAVPYFRTRCYVQDERYIAGEHMDVRRDCVSFARDQYLVSPCQWGQQL
jgi:hypothetical protein